jgi:hypothetical protein
VHWRCQTNIRSQMWRRSICVSTFQRLIDDAFRASTLTKKVLDI